MTLIRYDNDSFSERGLLWMKHRQPPREIIQIANDILDDFSDDGYTLTLRQLYYQFVGQGYLAENTQQAYKNLGTLITKARNNGLLSWSAIEDRGRSINGIYRHEENDYEAVNGLEYLLSLDYWKRQENYVEVWVEKDALINVVAKACGPLNCPHIATKGYLSASEAWRAGQRFKRAREAGKECFMIHLGDHDPEGLDMTRDNEHRLIKYSDGHVDVERIGLNMDQVRKYNPPPNYAKASSSRYDGYVAEYGAECWELDALDPGVIVDLITEAVEPHIDRSVWDETSDEEDRKRFHLEKLSDHWSEVKDLIDKLEL